MTRDSRRRRRTKCPGPGASKERAVTALALALGLVLVVSAGANTPPAPQAASVAPAGPAGVVEATVVEAGDAPFRASFDAPAVRPDHPPLDQIPAMPMPDEMAEERVSSGPGVGVIYDPVTGATTEVPMDFAAATAGFTRGGGYAGADGGGGGSEGEQPASFGTMSLLSTTTRAAFPWRMNVKVVMRWGSSYAVCSGSMRDAETVLTAGHCVYDYGGSGWADQVWVYPAWDGVGPHFNPPDSIMNPYGWASSTTLGAWTSWTGSGDLNYDVGLVGVGRAVGMLTGWFGWAYGSGVCPLFPPSQSYTNASYPAENCPISGRHNGRDMFQWGGTWDLCYSSNRLQINTSGGCYGALWGGMSGSGAYFIDGGRYVEAVASTSNRATWGRYARQWQQWVEWTNNTFLPGVRGSAFDLQGLDVNAAPVTIPAGGQTTTLNHLGANPTNGAASGTWRLRVYLSTNDNISSSDTLLSTQTYTYSFGAMSSVRVNMAQVTIPSNTPPGNYFLGIEYDPVTDGNSGNNDTDGWDAVAITVTKPDLDITTLSAPSSAKPGDTISVTNAVKNIGNATAGTSSLGLYISTDSTCTTTDTFLTSRTVPSLAPNVTSTATTSVSIPTSTTLGTKYICGIADRLSQVAESNEGNNTAFDAISIVQPNLRMTLVSAPPAADRGDTITVGNRVQNVGTASAGAFRVGVYYSQDPVCTTSDTLLATRAVASLAAGAIHSANTNVTIPAGAVAGTRYICGIADYLDQVSESSETDNTLGDAINILVPTVNLKINGADAVYPAVLTTGNPVNLTISMTAGAKPLDHYYALIWDGVIYWVTPSGSLSLTPVPLSNFTPVALTDLSLLGSSLPTGLWGFAWFMLDGGVAVDSDIILAIVTP